MGCVCCEGGSVAFMGNIFASRHNKITCSQQARVRVKGLLRGVGASGKWQVSRL